MVDTLTNPGDVLEGQGTLLQHGRQVAIVDYHLAIPNQAHFLINPTGKFHSEYAEHAGGFILTTPEDAKNVVLTEYTLELSDKGKRNIRVERCYKKIQRSGETRISFWVKVL